MKFTPTLLAAVLSISGFQQAVAFPSGEPQLEARASKIGDSKSNPIKGEIEIRGEDALTYDADCWAMLCKGKDSTMQKVATDAADVNRQVEAGSAASKQPFKDPSKNGIKSLPATNAWGSHQDWNSAEEFPFASTREGGKEAILVGVNTNSQNEQKHSLRSFYSKNKVNSYDPKTKKEDGTWFQVTGFKVKSGKKATVGPYCKAWMAKDRSVCDKNHKTTGDWGYDVAEYAYVYNHNTKKFDYVGK